MYNNFFCIIQRKNNKWKKVIYNDWNSTHTLFNNFFPPHYKITLDEHSSQSFMFMMDNLFEWDAEWVLNGIIHGQKSCLNNVFLLLFATYTIIFFFFVLKNYTGKIYGSTCMEKSIFLLFVGI